MRRTNALNNAPIRYFLKINKRFIFFFNKKKLIFCEI